MRILILLSAFVSLSLSEVITCTDQQYWDQTQKKCMECAVTNPANNCKTCWATDKCTSCNDGFYLNEDYKCKARDTQNCLTYDGLYCIECQQGYYISNMLCYTCALTNCAYCTSTKCFKCKDNLVLYEYIDTNGNEKQECVDCTQTANDEKCGRCPLGKYFDPDTFTCKVCREGCQRCTTKDNCYLCNTDTALINPEDPTSQCGKITGCLDGNYYGNHCELCEDTYFLSLGKCEKCETGCKRCIDATQCVECENGGTLTNGKCTKDPNCARSSSIMGCIECNEGYYLDDSSVCQACPKQCRTCLNSNYCFACAEDYYFTDATNGVCTVKDSRVCNVVDQYGCLQCRYDVTYNETLDKNVNEDLEDKSKLPKNPLLGFYLPIIPNTNPVRYEPTCEACNVTCRICEYNKNWCTGCNEGYALEINETAKAEYSKIFGVSVDIFMCIPKPDSCAETEMGYCIKCADKYFISQVSCIKCDESCDTCTKQTFCQSCNTTTVNGSGTNANYWRRPSDNMKSDEAKGLCLSVEQSIEQGYGLNCSGPITQSGCSSCHIGDYLDDGECKHCPSEGKERCYECKLSALDNGTQVPRCTSCQPDTEYLGKDDFLCYPCSGIKNCASCSNRGCYTCNEGYSVSADRMECTKVNLALIIPLVVVGLLLIIIVIAIIIFFVWRRKRKTMKEREKEIKPFKVSNAVEMALLSADNANFPLKTNKWTLNFGHAGSKVVIDQPYEETVEVSNTTKKSYFFEIIAGANHCYDLTAEPMRYTLKPGYAISVKFTIKMLCTAIVSNDIGIVAMDMDEELKETAKLSIIIESDLSTKLNHEELKLQMPAIGEGAFGMVFCGTYRGQKVAVKKMKARNLTEEQEKEFKHEVNMLTQYRHPCIVSLVGAVYTEGEISIVTEFADYGSLSKIWDKSQVSLDLKVKFMEDLVVALAFLHDNNIIHRDIKGENVLVYSLNPHSPVCGKLTDFGTCRNISERALSTKELSQGIGTPTYMSPECLANTAYTYSSDIYSLAMVLYETFTEKQAYLEDERFNQPWMIPQFVIEGKRLEKPNGIPENYWTLIEQCWKQEPTERPTIGQVYQTLVSWGMDVTNTELAGQSAMKQMPVEPQQPMGTAPVATTEPQADQADKKSVSSKED
ncbi:serine-threonine protein kinase, putative [Entamoeba invadens IP1]|uniref:Serine-threonine protein kinase, putative n=1 Tax=Entamoeba invadens IP1 TaxID=370355 RepID=A0A0A1U2N7_ENTIV|nr:serine-threonine protein kinase, putative [Entamoeba invadens IP1]ELP88322.1 serine-threonine protein kinase, putative [Entamoeba invadens IP1]|eukprot:XP_004255093.1 serine-threonine protein kinase, putative [Entamoeba invadens IP1]